MTRARRIVLDIAAAGIDHMSVRVEGDGSFSLIMFGCENLKDRVERGNAKSRLSCIVRELMQCVSPVYLAEESGSPE